MAGKIFISYRRADASAEARSIYLRLESIFGGDALFMDVDTIRHGRDFRDVIDDYLAQSAVQLVIIGPNWLGNAQGDTRLNDPHDFVRLEIAAGLQRNIPVIPILVGGAQMPEKEELPEDIAGLVYRQSARVSHENFAGDMTLIERDLKNIIKPARAKRLPMGALAIAGAILAVIALAAAVFVMQERTIPIATDTDTREDERAEERAFTSFEPNTDRPGGDYASHRLSQADPYACQTLCSEDQRCLAWTYVAPGYQEENAVCWLKNVVPEHTRQDVCCTSGVAYYRRPSE